MKIEGFNIRQRVNVRKGDSKLEWIDWADQQSRCSLGNQRSRRIEVRWRSEITVQPQMEGED